MPLNRHNSRVFHRTLYSGILKTVQLLKRNDDQQEGTVVPYTLFQCLLPGTQIEGQFIGGSRAMYSGEAVEIRSKGSSLRATINHPILTPDGFVPAGELVPGSKLVCDKLSTGRLSDSYKDHQPISVEDVFDSLSKFGRFSTRTPHPLDLYGDGKFIKGDIDIVRADGELLADVERQTEQTKHRVLSIHAPSGLSSPPFPIVDAFGNSDPPFEGLSTAGRGAANRSSYAGPCFGAHGSPLEVLDLFLASEDTSLNKNMASPAAIDGLNLIDSFTGEVIGNNPIFRFGVQPSLIREPVCFGRGSRFDIVKTEILDECGKTDPRLFCELCLGFPGQISLDEVVEIRHFHYDGPVYDFETPFGYYTASELGNKIFVSNCWRSSITKRGEAIQAGMSSEHRCTWHLPRVELDRLGIAYINVLDRIVENTDADSGPSYNLFRWWQPESDETIYVNLFETAVAIDCVRIDPPNIQGAM